MKINSTYLRTLLLMALVSIMACKKEQTVLPQKEKPTPLNEIQASYKKALVAETNGWFISYQPTAQSEEIAIWMKFLENDSLILKAGYSEFHEEQHIGSYGFGGQVSTEILFSKNTLWATLEKDLNGSHKFKITLENDGTFKLRRADGFDDKFFILKKATAPDLQVLQQQIDVILGKIAYEREQQRLRLVAAGKLATLGADNVGFYFQNLTVDDFSAYWSELDTVAKKFTLKWKEGVTEKEGVFSYTLVPNGIALNPKLQSGTVMIDTIKFDDYSDHQLAIASAGNAGAGSWGYKHVPAYPYQTAIAGAPAGYTTADLFIRGELPRFFGYTLDDLNAYYSPALQAHREQLRQAMSGTYVTGSVFRFQFYNHSDAGSTAANRLNSLQILTRNASNGSVFLPYYYDIQKKDANHVIITFNGGTSTASAPFLNAAQELMAVIFPPEGLTVVPVRKSGSNQLLRLVSRKDSRIWVELLVSTPTGIYFN